MSLETSMLKMSGIRYRQRYVFRDFNVEGECGIRYRERYVFRDFNVEDEWNKISSKICL
jgi:hypothetical protein